MGEAILTCRRGLLPTPAEIGAAAANHTHTAAQVGAAASNHTHTAAQVGALASNGNAVSATKLATARTIRVNLASAAAPGFDGTGNIAPGVSGILPVANGGTGTTSIAALKSALGISGGNVIAGSYVGNGRWGRSYPNSITFSFAPMLVVIAEYMNYSITTTIKYYPKVIVSKLTTSWGGDGLGYENVVTSGGKNYVTSGKRSSDSKTVYWYAEELSDPTGTDCSSQQFNQNGTTYHYFAIA